MTARAKGALAGVGVAFAALLAAPLCAEPPAPGQYRLTEGPDAAGGLELLPEGRFRYFLIVGALDEQAEGRWERQGDAICLTTEPRPVPAAFTRVNDANEAPGESGQDERPTLLVTWPGGQGIAGIDFRIGFAQGDPIEGYTQYYGWTMPEDDPRTPIWIEVSEPIYRLASPRFELSPQDGGKLHLELTPNDLGVADFENACLTATADGAVLHRPEGEMRFARLPARDPE